MKEGRLPAKFVPLSAWPKLEELLALLMLDKLFARLKLLNRLVAELFLEHDALFGLSGSNFMTLVILGHPVVNVPVLSNKIVST